MNIRTLTKLVEALRSLGVTHYKTSEIELTLDLSKPTTKEVKKRKVGAPSHSETTLPEGIQEKSMIPNAEQLSDEEALFWSVGFDPKEIKSQSPDA